MGAKTIAASALVLSLLAGSTVTALLTGTANAQTQTAWKDLGPGPGEIDQLAVDPYNSSLILAGGHLTGLYRSTDGGTSWSRVGLANGLDQSNILSIAASDSFDGQVFMTAGDDLFVSTDYGLTWHMSTHCSGKALQYYIDLSHPSLHYLICGSQLQISQDGGLTWHALPVTGSPGELDAVTTSGDKVIVLGCCQFNPGMNSDILFIETSGLSTWTSHVINDTVMGHSSLAVSPTNPSDVLVNGVNAVWQSNDGGVSWRRAINSTFGTSQGFVYYDHFNGSVAYAGRTALYKSVDSGRTFEQVGAISASCVSNHATLTYHADVGAIAFIPGTSKIIIGTDGGPHVSLDAGATWRCLPLGMLNALTTSVGVDPYNPNHLVVTRQDFFGPMQTFDGGMNWHDMASPPFENGEVVFDPSARGTLYISGIGGIWKSTNNGTSFQTVNTGLPSESRFIGANSFALTPANSTNLWAAYFTLGLFRSANGGASWSRVDNFTYAEAVYSYGGDVYIWEVPPPYTASILLKSSDLGKTWTFLTLPSTDNYPFVIADPANSSRIFVGGYSRDFPLTGDLRASYDGGLSFSRVNLPSGFAGTPLVQVSHVGPNTLLIVRNFLRVDLRLNLYASSNLGASWEPITGNLNVTNISQLVIDPSNSSRVILAIWGEGVVSGRLSATYKIASTTTTGITSRTNATTISTRITSTPETSTSETISATTASTLASSVTPTSVPSTTVPSTSRSTVASPGAFPNTIYIAVALTVGLLLVISTLALRRSRRH